MANSYWNYRVVKRTNDCGETEFGVHEVYYYNDGKIQGIVADAVSPISHSLTGLQNLLRKMLQDNPSDVAREDGHFSDREQIELWLQATDEDILEADI